jgi:NADH-quinone oxidoreductase subunit G
MTVAGGHGARRYLGKKRTYRDQYLGVFIQHEMNRCIHCWRCRRFYQEFAGYRDLGAMQMAYRTYFGRYKDGPLDSPFSGNLIDLCPTGVYTDKPSRFKGRRWDYQRGSSLCVHCSLGCNVIASVRYREIVRLEARFNEWVNGHFICDRGRYGFHYASLPDRPRRARINGQEVSWEKAVRVAEERLKQVTQEGGSIACLGSSRSSLENQAALKYLCRRRHWNEPAYFQEPSVASKVKNAVLRLNGQLALSMREVEKTDFILTVGADPVNEAPMLALAMRQAYRNGAKIVSFDPRPIVLPFEFDRLPVAISHIDLAMSLLVKKSLHRHVAETCGPDALRFYDALPPEFSYDAGINDRIVELSSGLEKSLYPVIICGTDIVQGTTPGAAADNARLLRAAKEKAGLFYLLPGANAFGAALLSSEDTSLTQIVEAIEDGTIKALILVETDPFSSFPDRQRLEQAVRKLDLLLTLDYIHSESARRSHILFPTVPLFETASTFINQEGRVQFQRQVHAGGSPMEQISAGGHPPRNFRKDIPGGEPRPAWQILNELADAQEMSLHDLRDWLVQENPAFKKWEAFDPEGNTRLIPDTGERNSFPLDFPGNMGEPSSSSDSLDLLLADWTFGTEELSGYSPYIRQVEKVPCLFMHIKDAEKAGLKDKDRAVLHLGEERLEIEVTVVENMAPGCMVLPRHHQMEWQKVKGQPVRVPINRMKKI